MNYYGYAEPLPWEFAAVAPPLRYQIPCYPSVDGWPLPYKSYGDTIDIFKLRELYEKYRKEVLASNGFSVRQYNFGSYYIRHIIKPILEPESHERVTNAVEFVLEEHRKMLAEGDSIDEDLEQKYCKAKNKQKARKEKKDKLPVLPLTNAKVVKACGQTIEQGSYLYITFRAQFDHVEHGIDPSCLYEALVFSRRGVRSDNLMGDIFTLCFIRHAKARR